MIAPEKKFFTPEELTQWATDDPQTLLEAALLQVSQLQQRSTQLNTARKRIKELEDLLEEALRAKHRQAAPFRVEKEKRTTTRKKPGRKEGHPGTCRPEPTQIDEEISVELSLCTQCGASQWRDEQVVEQIIEEIPVMRPRVTRLRTYRATCVCCGVTNASKHPLQVSQATGAAGVHLGPRALGICADLNKAKGLSMRKTCAVLKDHFQLQITPGGLSQALVRVAARAEPQYVALREYLLQAKALHVDETSWWVEGELWWLWVFTHDQGTVYVVDKSRARRVLTEVIGESFPGVLVSDCLSIYDLENGEQQKCYSHHFEAIRDAKKLHPQNGDGFLKDISTVLKDAIALGKTRAKVSAEAFEKSQKALTKRANDLLSTEREQPAEESVRKRIAKQEDHLFTFLKHEGVDATNNLAERQLRPAVITRKISCGNKTPAGAKTFQILASIAATCVQAGSNFINLIASTMPLRSG